MYLNTDIVTDRTKKRPWSTLIPSVLTDGYVTGRPEKDVDQCWIERCIEPEYWGQGSQ